MKTKILFINAIDIHQSVESFLPPLGLGYLASSLREKFGKNSFEFRIISNKVSEEIKKFKPDLVGITAVSQNYNLAKKYAKIAKKYGLPVIIGGVHITTLPSTLTPDMDIAVISEGEKTIGELFDLYTQNNLLNKKALKKIKGIAFRNRGKITLTGPRPMIQPLDQIPMPARDLMAISNPTYMFSSRGCPYRCHFCASCRFWKTTRFFSAPYVVREIKYLHQKYQITHIDFWDDLFIANRKRLKQIFILLKKENLLGKLSFGCSLRSNLVDEDLVRQLKEMNFTRVSMGLESASPRILEYLKGTSISVQNHQKAITLFQKYKIPPGASFIIGSPQETKEEILQTLNFIKKNPLRGFDVYVLTPLPGTPIWEYALKKGLVGQKMDWRKLNVDFAKNYKRAIILSETLTRKELYQLFRKFEKEKTRKLIFYGLKNPFKILKYLIVLPGKKFPGLLQRYNLLKKKNFFL